MKSIYSHIAILFLSCMSYSMLAQMYDIDSAIDRLTSDMNTDVIVRTETRINTDKWEYSPVLYDSGIVYIGSRSEDKFFDRGNKTPFFTLRYAEIMQNGRLAFPQVFGPKNLPELHEGPAEFTKAGDYMFYTLSAAQDEKVEIPLQIYSARKIDDDWENVGPLEFISEGYNYAHPTLNEAEDEMVFAANLDDSYGGMDLYMSKKINGVWTDPVNLGIQVNSAGNELFPRFHPSGILFFSSDGLSKGKYLDIYATYKVDGKYVNPVKLGAPFNSKADDFGLIFLPDGKSGYFTSGRDGKKSRDDIYYFKADEELIPHIKKTYPTRLIAQDEISLKRLDGASVYLEELDENGLIANKDFYNTEMITEEDEVRILMRWKDPEEFPTAMNRTNLNGFAEIEYTFDKPAELIVVKDGYRVYRKRLDAYQESEIQVQMEFIDCMNFSLETRGQNSEKLRATVRVVNECNKEEHNLDEDSYANFKLCLQPDCYYTFYVSHPGFTTDTFVISAENLTENSATKIVQLVANKDIKEIVTETERNITDIENVRKGEVITLRKIYYDFNKATIRKGAAEELEVLAGLMKKYPAMKIELDSHTDSRGAALYNLELSLKRALSAKEYLVGKGIAADRIVAVGYGDSILLNDCVKGVECSEEEHQFNRRTEVRILSSIDADIRKVDNTPEIIDKRND